MKLFFFVSVCTVGCAELIRTHVSLFNLPSCDRCQYYKIGIWCYFVFLCFCERSNFIFAFVIWKEMITEMLFFARTPFYNLIYFKASLMFVLEQLIERGNTIQ